MSENSEPAVGSNAELGLLINMLRAVQSHFGASRRQCDSPGRVSWDTIDLAVAEIERQRTVIVGYERIYNDAMRALRETVDERDKLRSYLVRYRDEVPLGHQPHMMAHLVDEALGRA